MAEGIFGTLIEQAMAPTKKPKVPGAPNVNPQTAQRDAILGNEAIFPELESLVGDVNAFNLSQRQSMLRGAVPGYEDLTGGASDLLTGWLGGQLSPDVASAVRRNANARAVAGGYGGGGGSPLYGPSMKDTLEWRDLGLAADTGQQRAMSLLPGYLSTIAGLGMPKQYDPVAAFLSPETQITAQQWNETNRYGRDWLQNQLDSLPDPTMAAIAGALGREADFTESLAKSYFTGGLGGMGGGGGSKPTGSEWNTPYFNTGDAQALAIGGFY